MAQIRKGFDRVISYLILYSVYNFTLLVCKIFNGQSKSIENKRSGKLLVISTFHNPNWFISHMKPLTQSGVKEVILVCDKPVMSMKGVRFACPPPFLSKMLSRAGAKFLWAIICGIRFKPDLYMGYHIFPASVSALIIARLFGRSACYQVTSGPLELEGGGWRAENKLLVSLGKATRSIERLVFSIVKEFDLVVVRGRGAANFIRTIGYKNKLAIITGSVNKQNIWFAYNEREIDVIFVGRLTECKRPDRFIAIVKRLSKHISDANIVMVGDGPEKDELYSQARKLGIENRIEFLGKRKDVSALLARTKVYVLTSRWEGLSIAMMEAMAAGAVPVVSDVGDLKDLIRDGVNGYIVDENAIHIFADRIVSLLNDEELWTRLSHKAVKDAMEYSGVKVISNNWNNALKDFVKMDSLSGSICRF